MKIKIIIGILLFLLGAVIGAIIHNYCPLFPFEDKINAVDLATLIVTIFLAIYLPFILDKLVESKRKEKEIIIRKIEQLQLTIGDINSKVTECVQKNSISSFNTYYLISKFTTLSNQLDTIISIVKHCHKNVFDEYISKIKTFRYEYKNCVTGGGFQKKEYKFSALTKKDEERIYQNFDKELAMFIIKLNEK